MVVGWVGFLSSTRPGRHGFHYEEWPKFGRRRESLIVCNAKRRVTATLSC